MKKILYLHQEAAFKKACKRIKINPKITYGTDTETIGNPTTLVIFEIHKCTVNQAFDLGKWYKHYMNEEFDEK